MIATQHRFRFLAVDSCGKRVLAAAGAVFLLGLLAVRPLRAQNVIHGTAGFGTGLQTLATNVTLVPGAGATVYWGDGTSDSALLSCGFSLLVKKQCAILGTHLYSDANTYPISISYTASDLGCGFLGLSSCPGSASATANISPPGKFVILSIGDSIASGEGDPVVSDNEPGNPLFPDYAFWDDAYSNYLTQPPDEAAEWPNQSFPCHSSAFAGPAQAAAVIASTNSGVTFIHYACSGATIGPKDTAASWAQDAVGQLKIARERLARYGAGIDILLISAGSNSVYGPGSFGNGFGAIVQYCLNPVNDCDNNDAVITDLSYNFDTSLPAEYKMLAMEINCVQPPSFFSELGRFLTYPDPGCTDRQKQIPKLVLITEYMDPTHDQNGNFATIYSCPAVAFRLVDQAEWQFFYDSIVGPLNADVDRFPLYALTGGLTVPTYAVTGIGGRTLPNGQVDPNDPDDFLTHGACSGNQRWVNNIHDSETLLGKQEPPNPGNNTNTLPGGTWTNGSLHPNTGIAGYLSNGLFLFNRPVCGQHCGQEDFRDRIYAAITTENPPATTAFATSDAYAYRFGTWTSKPVDVVLSAANAVTQAGVGPTFFAVDNLVCYPAVGIGSLNTPPGCSRYNGPITISATGQHTLTYFSVNAHGFPEEVHMAQVWINPKAPPPTSAPSVHLVATLTSLNLETITIFGFFHLPIGYSATVNIENTGTVTAANVTVTGALNGVGGGSAEVSNLPSGASFSVTLQFPLSAGAQGSGGVLTTSEAYDGGTAGGAFRVKLP